MEAGTIPGIDFRKLTPEAQSAAEAIWSTLPEWDALGRTAEEACPLCYQADE